MKTNTTVIPSVNFHLWEPCNFKCKFCFASFQDVRKTILPKGHLPKEDAVQIVTELAEAGFEKITFVGGEPTLCPWLPNLIITAKTRGLTTMVVTNGSELNEKFLSSVKGYLDWIVISIDSLSSESNVNIGRYDGKRIIPDKNYYLEKTELVKNFGIKLKINTVVNHFNFRDQSLGDFIKALQPIRWKIFKALRVVGQNDDAFDEVSITDKQFELFLSLNKAEEKSWAVTEDNEEMTGSYAMVDPAGRFFDNTSGRHSYSKPILEVGVGNAIKEVNIDYSKFLERGGVYEW